MLQLSIKSLKLHELAIILTDFFDLEVVFKYQTKKNQEVLHQIKFSLQQVNFLIEHSVPETVALECLFSLEQSRAEILFRLESFHYRFPHLKAEIFFDELQSRLVMKVTDSCNLFFTLQSSSPQIATT